MTPFIIATLIFATGSLALEFKDVEEAYQCESFPVASNFDTKWQEGVPYFYAPFVSNGFAYKIAEDFHTPEQIAAVKESLTELGPSCFYLLISLNDTKATVQAYDKPNYYNSYPDPIRKGIRHFTFPNGTESQPAQYSSTAYTTLTDNKTYFLNINSWAGGSKNFIVIATVPVLPEGTLSEIKTHLLSHGFKAEHFNIQDYTTCNPIYLS